MAAYAGALFIRSEAEIKRPVVLLSGERLPPAQHACMHATCMHIRLPLDWREGQSWAGSRSRACCRSSTRNVPPAGHLPAGERTNVFGVLEKHFKETALPPSERFWRAVRSCSFVLLSGVHVDCRAMPL